jgi:7-cyano-7-deazaguanine synthase
MEDNKTRKAVAIVSGGMDSVTLAYDMATRGYEMTLLSFDYGQRHKKELEFARLCAERLQANHHVVNLTSITALLTGSALTDPDVIVPHGHYEAETMKLTVVPNRNAMMLSVAYAVAVAQGAVAVGAGFHNGDSAIYPDCRPKFVNLFRRMEAAANEGFLAEDFRLYTPFIEVGKDMIVRLGESLDVPYEETWSCYEGGIVHCGRCGTCVERKEAFRDAGVLDPTQYADPLFEIPAYQ